MLMFTCSMSWPHHQKRNASCSFRNVAFYQADVCPVVHWNMSTSFNHYPNLAFIFQGAGGNISSSCAVNSLLLPLACPGDSSFSAHRFGVSEAAPVLMASAMGVPNLLVGDFILSFVKGGTRETPISYRKKDFRVRFSLRPYPLALPVNVNAPHTQGISTDSHLGPFRACLI